MSRQGIAVTRCYRLFQKRPDGDDMGMPARASQQAQRKETRTRDRYENLRAVLAERNHDHSLVRWCLGVHKLRTTADRRHSAADDRRRGTVAFLPAVCRLAAHARSVCGKTLDGVANRPSLAAKGSMTSVRLTAHARSALPPKVLGSRPLPIRALRPRLPVETNQRSAGMTVPTPPQRRAKGRAKVRPGAVEEGEMDGSLPDIKEVTVGRATAKNCSKRDEPAKAS